MSSSPSPRELDVLVIGAGPAGLTLATLLAKYRPSTRVAVVERGRLPQHKIGESLLVDVNRILADMGALEAVERAGFSRKYGVTFLWGSARTVHSFLWREGEARVEPPSGYHLDYTWHVDRHRYDQILAETARARGVTVLEEHAVTEVIRDGERVVGARVDTPGGPRELASRWLVDCAGQRGPLTRRDSGRALDEALRNVAVWEIGRASCRERV
jgi:FAD-dependent halogenase